MSDLETQDSKSLELVFPDPDSSAKSIVLGCMSYGSDSWAKWVLNEDKALPLLKAAWDAGIQTWDTANVYSNVSAQFISTLTLVGCFRTTDCESNQEI